MPRKIKIRTWEMSEEMQCSEDHVPWNGICLSSVSVRNVRPTALSAGGTGGTGGTRVRALPLKHVRVFAFHSFIHLTFNILLC